MSRPARRCAPTLAPTELSLMPSSPWRPETSRRTLHAGRAPAAQRLATSTLVFKYSLNIRLGLSHGGVAPSPMTMCACVPVCPRTGTLNPLVICSRPAIVSTVSHSHKKKAVRSPGSVPRTGLQNQKSHRVSRDKSRLAHWTGGQSGRAHSSPQPACF